MIPLSSSCCSEDFLKLVSHCDDQSTVNTSPQGIVHVRYTSTLYITVAVYLLVSLLQQPSAKVLIRTLTTLRIAYFNYNILFILLVLVSNSELIIKKKILLLSLSEVLSNSVFDRNIVFALHILEHSSYSKLCKHTLHLLVTPN